MYGICTNVQIICYVHTHTTVFHDVKTQKSKGEGKKNFKKGRTTLSGKGEKG